MRKTLAVLALVAMTPFATSALAQNSQAQASGEMRSPTDGTMQSPGVDGLTTSSTRSDMPQIVPPESDDDGGILVPGSGAQFRTPPAAPENSSQEEAITDDGTAASPQQLQ